MSACSDCYKELFCSGCLACTGFTQCDWNRNNACWECWDFYPCCGRPDLFNCALCCFNWYILCWCNSCRLYASSLNQTYSVFPHCLCGTFCVPCMHVLTRYNLRRRMGVKGNMVGDCLCMACCCPCACGQNLRSVNISAWRFFPEFPLPEKAALPLALIR